MKNAKCDKANRMQRSRRHHYIPRFWIRRWCNERGVTYRYTRQIDGRVNELKRPPKSVGYWQDLYTPPPNFPSEMGLEELFFKKLDDRTAKVFSQLGNSKRLTGEEAITLAIFLMSLMHRTPSAMAS